MPDCVNIEVKEKSWLQLFVDATMERDPYKRLALVRELRNVPRHHTTEEVAPQPVIKRYSKPVIKARVKSAKNAKSSKAHVMFRRAKAS